MLRKISLIVFLCSLLVCAGAREFWLQPIKFFFVRGEKLVVSFKTGDNLMVEPWDLKKSQVGKLELHQLTKFIDLSESVKEDSKDNLTVTWQEDGTYLIAMQTNNVFNELDADKFNMYLKEDGMDEVLERRQKTNTLELSGKEVSAQYAKLLVQVGNKTDDTYKKVVGFPVEIIPLQNPYALQKGDLVRFKILFEGQPVLGVKVKVWNRFDNRTTLQNIYTEKDGTIEMHISNPGSWMVTVASLLPSKQTGADWQSYRGSLMFGIH